ncbi:MAG: hypothetical protein KDM63_05405 [Verrucomicrobiae bacterium]|nr:hypothetical protein [Verrucomicrobiae bacterium]
MKPISFAIFGLFIAMLVFVSLSQRKGQEGPDLHPANSHTNPSAPLPQKIKPWQSPKNIQAEVGNRNEEKKSSVEVFLDQLPTSPVAKRTPEMDRNTIERVNQAREPQYRALFASWRLDEKTINSALEIIYERELRMMENTTKFFHLERSYSNEYKARRKAEEATAELLLITLLGSERFNELSQLEEDRFSKFKQSLGISE